jgi:prepilin-type N-terminal cleavage/methylation domain-containing protein
MRKLFARRPVGPRRPKSHARGMSLIEMLIVVALSALIMIALLSLYMAGQRYFFNQNSRADAIEDSRMPMAWISRDIRDASNVHDGAITAYDGGTYATGANCLVLELPSIDASGLIISGSTDYIVYTYDATNHRLIRIIDPGGGVRTSDTRVMADGLANDGSGNLPFQLKYYESNGTTEVTSSYSDTTAGAFIVEVQLTSQGRSMQRGNQPFMETVRTQAKLRNKNIPS